MNFGKFVSDGSWLRELLTSGRERIIDIEGITDVLDMSEDVRLMTAAAAERDAMALVVAFLDDMDFLWRDLTDLTY